MQLLRGRSDAGQANVPALAFDTDGDGVDDAVDIDDDNDRIPDADEAAYGLDPYHYPWMETWMPTATATPTCRTPGRHRRPDAADDPPDITYRYDGRPAGVAAAVVFQYAPGRGGRLERVRVCRGHT